MSIRWIPTYNAPVVLTYALLALVVHAADMWSGGVLAPGFFAALPEFDYASFWSWFRLVSHAVILLIGPVLEEKHGSRPLFYMILATALVTGVLNTLFFNTGLMGASGVVFMMILLGSFANHKPGEIPLTFLLVVGIYLAGEVTAAFQDDGVSQFAHILGGLCGTVFGFGRGVSHKTARSGRKAPARRRDA